MKGQIEHKGLKWKKKTDEYFCGEYKINHDKNLRFPFRLYSAHGMLLFSAKFERVLDFAAVHHAAQSKEV